MNFTERHVYFDSKSIPDLTADIAEKVVLDGLYEIVSSIDFAKFVLNRMTVPTICLDQEIKRGVVELHDRRRVNRNMNEQEKPYDDPYFYGDYLPFDISREFESEMETIVLGEFVKDTNTVKIYYRAIEEYAHYHHLDFKTKIRSTLAHYLFEAMFYDASASKIYWSTYTAGNGTEKEKKLIRLCLPEFFEYCWCMDKGNAIETAVAKDMLDQWCKYYYSDWLYAQTLVFFCRRGICPTDDLFAARKKHRATFNQAICANNVYDALKSMYS